MSRHTIQRVTLRNYKSIAGCSVELGSLTMLVGPNGSGKSNLLDALALTAEGMSSLEDALNRRGGIQEVRRRSSGHPTHFSIAIDLLIDGDVPARYAYSVGALKEGGFSVFREQAQVGDARYEIRDGVFHIAPSSPFPVSTDRLSLYHAGADPKFRPLFEAILKMRVYAIHPAVMRQLAPSDRGTLLSTDAWNIASVIRRMQKTNPGQLQRALAYLRQIVPGLENVEPKTLSNRITLSFSQRVGARHPWRFLSIAMSDGTLRALGVLIAIFQRQGKSAPSVIGVEEPEAALHPAATGVLFDALREASQHTQVLITTHSPDLLDHPDLDHKMLRAVEMEAGKTLIGPIDEGSASIIRDGLYTGGALLRMAQLEPNHSTSTPTIFKRWRAPQ